MVRTRIAEKKKGGGSTAAAATGGGGENGVKKNGDELLDQEVHKAIQRELGLLKKQLTLEPIQDNTEKQVRLVIAILRMNISALRGTIIHDSGPTVAAERKAAVDRLVNITNAFDAKKHTAESINEDARTALNELSDTFKVFGPSWISIRDSIVQLALEQIEDIKAKDPLQKEKEELEKLEKRARKIQEKELMERRERERAEKEKKKKKKKNKKNTPATNDEHYDDFGDERVPPQPACEHLTCRCMHDQESEYYSHSLADSDGVVDESTDVHSIHSNPDDYSTRSRSTSSTFSSDDQPVLSHVMSVEYWSQFCYFYDQGSK